MKECKLYEKEKGKKVRCLACCHRCLISENEFGVCGVRKNISGKLYLLVYGKIASMNVDPIEKKPLYHFLPGSKAFSIGTVGCNFKCSWCQNFEISQISKGKEAKIYGKEMNAEEIVDLAIKSGCKSIAYTYNEPAIFSEFVFDVATLAKEKGICNILVTNGYFTKESIQYLDGLIDAANVDLKSFSEKAYTRYCGAKLKHVLECIRSFYEKGIHLEITTLIIPGVNDNEKELSEIAKFIFSIDKKGNIPWHISRFFPMYKMFNTSEVTSIETLKKAKEIGIKVRLKHIHIGNV